MCGAHGLPNFDLASQKCVDPWANLCSLLSVWQPEQPLCMGRAVPVQRLRKVGSPKDLCEECGVPRSDWQIG